MKRRLTMAQAIVAYLQNQYSARDGQEHRFFAGVLGIFGHGNVAGIGQALEQYRGLQYYLCRNEQAMVHTAVATVNRLPVLLIPGDIFARRNVAPVLQQLESSSSQDVSVNDCFKPVSRYWDRIQRPEQLLTALPEALRVLTSPAET